MEFNETHSVTVIISLLFFDWLALSLCDYDCLSRFSQSVRNLGGFKSNKNSVTSFSHFIRINWNQEHDSDADIVLHFILAVDIYANTVNKEK